MSVDGRAMRRRRECRNCDYRFTTYEKEEELVFYIRKKEGHAEPYHRDKALRSIQVACQKRPVKVEEMEFMLSQMERKIIEAGEKTIPSSRLGDLIMEELHSLDPVAYIRFASVYKDFKNPSEFLEILNSLR
jgi:transcriptional repressor NrdR